MNKEIKRHQARMLQNKSSTYMNRKRSNSSPGVSNSNLTEGNIPKNKSSAGHNSLDKSFCGPQFTIKVLKIS
jgi:hypothetical protein